MQVLEVIHDLDKDRYITYEQFSEFLKTLPMYSKQQCFYLLLGMTGFRPIECCQLTTRHLIFEDLDNPLILNRITKSKTKTYYDAQGRVLAVKHIKIKRRTIPLWVRDYVLEYVIRHGNTFKCAPDGSYYLFSAHHLKKDFIDTASWCADISKLRKRFYAENPEKWGWMRDVAHQRIQFGNVAPIYKFSLYSFRKARATWHGMELMHKGVMDIAFNVSKFMGHSRVNTTYTYIQSLISERAAGNLVPIKPPDLSKPIFLRENFRQTKLFEF